MRRALVASAVIVLFPLGVSLCVAILTGAVGGQGTLFGPQLLAPESECDESLTYRFGGYRGCQTQTITGRACANWEALFRNRTAQGYTGWDWEKRIETYPNMRDSENFCRNPGVFATIHCWTWTPLEDNPNTPERDESESLHWEYCHPLGDKHACYVVPPWDESKLGMPGFDPFVALEGTVDHNRLVLTKLLAVLSSSAGLAIAVGLKLETDSFASAYALEGYKTYIRYLLTYFGSAVAINVVACVTFSTYRCVHHNLVSSGVSGASVKILYLLTVLFSGLLTNALLDRLLLMRARMFTPVGEERALKWLDRFTRTQMGLCAFASLLGCIVEVNVVTRGYASLEAGNLNPMLMVSALFRLCGLALAIIHALVSVMLMCLLRRIAKTEQHGSELTVFVYSSVAVLSTVVVYLNWVLGFANLFLLMPIDSIVNDFCLAAISFSAPSKDVADARRVVVAEMALTVGREENAST